MGSPLLVSCLLFLLYMYRSYSFLKWSHSRTFFYKIVLDWVLFNQYIVPSSQICGKQTMFIEIVCAWIVFYIKCFLLAKATFFSLTFLFVCVMWLYCLCDCARDPSLYTTTIRRSDFLLHSMHINITFPLLIHSWKWSLQYCPFAQ